MMNNQTKVLSLVAVVAMLAIIDGFPVAVRAEETSSQSEEQGRPWMKNDRERPSSERSGERAMDRKVNQENRENMRQEAFCDRLSDRMSRVQERISERSGKASDRRVRGSGEMLEGRTNRDQKLSEERKARAARREEMYQKLMERAGDDAAKQEAVSVFKAAIEQAVTAREKAIDAAITAFRLGVDAAIGSKKAAIESGVNSYEAAVRAAFELAIASCKNGDDPSAVRTTLEAALRTAREGVKDERQASETIGEQVRALTETKRAVFEKAMSEFKAAVEAARADLKKVLGSPSSSSGESQGE